MQTKTTIARIPTIQLTTYSMPAFMDQREKNREEIFNCRPKKPGKQCNVSTGIKILNAPKIEDCRQHFVCSLGFCVVFFLASATLAMSCSSRHSSVDCYWPKHPKREKKSFIT